MRRPLFWAVLTGFAMQFLWGIFSVIFGFFLLAAADTDRCPLAAPLRPFFGYVAGAVLAVCCYEWCLLWGIFFNVDNPRNADPFLISREWWHWPTKPLRRGDDDLFMY